MTIAGQHTGTELKDLIAAKDKEFAVWNAAYSSFQRTWNAKDKAASDSWIRDYALLHVRYNAAKAVANNALTNSLAEKEWNGVISSLQDTAPGKEDGQVALARRLLNAGAPMPQYSVPQPSAPDSDLQTYTLATELQHTVATKTDTTLKTALIIGGAALFGWILFESWLLTPKRNAAR